MTQPQIQTRCRSERSDQRPYLPFAVALAVAVLSLVPNWVHAQPTGPPPTTIPALFLSDIHFDPYADPAKVARLNSAPAAAWPAILASPASPTQAQDFAALQTACPVRGIDTDYTLLQSSLKAIHANALHTTFVTISGDLLAHSFDCKYRHILPGGTPAEYVAFTQKTIQYIVSSLRSALPGAPVYTAMGNNDSGCTDYHLDATHDAFLAAVAPMVVDALPSTFPKSERQTIADDFATGGYFSAPIAGLPHTHLIILDDLFLSPEYATCSAHPDPAPAAAQLAWLSTQLDLARQHHEHVWVMGHIPPGVNLYATAKKFLNICAGAEPKLFLASDALGDILAHNSDIIRLALFGHTHDDELRLLAPPPPLTTDHLPLTTALPGVPLKIVASISPVNGNRPTFTLAKIDPASATLIDYTIIQASNLTGKEATWSAAYTYSSAYHQPAFDPASLSTLISTFQSDPAAQTPASQSYLHNYYPGGALSALLQFVWPQYTCSLNHTSAAAFTACACAATPTPATPQAAVQ